MRVAVHLAVSVMMLGTAHMAMSETRGGSAGKPRGAVHSDFNADGFADLAVGVPLEDVGSVVDAGAVNVLYGSAGGLQATSPDDQFWSQDSPEVQDAAETGDQFGSSLTAGDFNGDGFADLAVGVPLEDVETRIDAGGTNVLYGSIGELQATFPADQFWSQDSPQVKNTAETGDQFGFSLAAGDFNFDGAADLAVGVPLEDLKQGADAGAVNVLYGSVGGLQAISPDDQFLNQISREVADRAEPGDEFGLSLAAGDLFGNGFADLAVGVPLEDLRNSDVGAVNILSGATGGLDGGGLWSQLGFVRDDAEPGDEFGFSLAMGNFAGDRSDLVAGVPFEDGKSDLDGGAINVWNSNQFWTQDSLQIKDVFEEGDQFAYSLVSG